MRADLDSQRTMRYDAGKKSALLAYILWFFLGWFGVHRFYLGRITSGIVMLILWGLSWLTHFILIGFVGFAVIGLWWLIDALLIPGMVRSYNEDLIEDLHRR